MRGFCWHPSKRISSLAVTCCTCPCTGSVGLFFCASSEPLTESLSSAEPDSVTTSWSALSNLSVEVILKSEQCSLIPSKTSKMFSTALKSFLLVSYKNAAWCLILHPRTVFCFQSDIPQHLWGFNSRQFTKAHCYLLQWLMSFPVLWVGYC